jgi:hypothetical protein
MAVATRKGAEVHQNAQSVFTLTDQPYPKSPG